VPSIYLLVLKLRARPLQINSKTISNWLSRLFTVSTFTFCPDCELAGVGGLNPRATADNPPPSCSCFWYRLTKVVLEKRPSNRVVVVVAQLVYAVDKILTVARSVCGSRASCFLLTLGPDRVWCTVQLSEARVEDSGSYTVTASNRLGNVSTTATLTVTQGLSVCASLFYLFI